MHSKVIIASLACVIAASFANGRVSNASVAKTPQLKTQETSCCSAPNEDGINAYLYADKPYQNCDFCAFLQGIEYQSPLADGLEVMANPSGLSTYIGYNPAYGHYFNVAQPSADGDYYATIGSRGKEIATVYIYRKNGVCYGSVLSKFDTRAKYYMNEVATSSELSYYPQSWNGSETLNSTTAINAVKHYGTYVYSGTSDMTMTVSTTSRSGWNDWGSNLSIKVQVEMYKNGQVYPVESARVRLFSSGSELASGTTKRTGTTGMYTYSMNFMDTFNKTLGNLQIGVFTDCGQGKIKDNYGLDYPYIYTSTSSTQLFNLKTITYKVRVYPERSDRAAAYELSQAAFVPYRYAINYGHSVSGAKILYPAEKTSYFTSVDNYFGITTTQLIAIKRAHYNAWDVIGHEYGHFICDKLNLSMDPSNDVYWTHGYKEDLIMTYNDWDNGLRMAYSEGLATYFSVAAQLDRAVRYPNSYCASIADEKYVDPINGVNADFNQYRFGVQNGAFGQAVESTIASTLIKILDDVNRTDDNVALGHTAMWNAIIAAGSSTSDIFNFIDMAVSQNSEYIMAIYKILDREYIPHANLPEPAEWTIMFYMCGSTLESGGGANSACNISSVISNILQVPYLPSNFNIIIETGGCTEWHGDYNIPNDSIARYYVRHSQLNSDNSGATFDRYASMGSESAFESFLRWGLTYYPAQKTGVILMNHGGAMSGVCFDALHDHDSLSNAEVKQALRNVLGENPSEKLEFISYDACLMAEQDVLSFNSKYFNYMTASEDEITEDMVSGISVQWLSDLYQGFNTLYALRQMGHDFVQNGCGWEQTYTVFDLGQVAAYHDAFENFAARLSETIRDQDDVHALRSILESQYIPHCQYTHDIDKYCIADVYTFLNDMKTQWYASEYITPSINEVLSYFPSEEQYQVDWSTNFNPVELTDDGLILYHTNSFGVSGSRPMMHGLSLHFGYYDEFNECYFPASETDFNVWRSIFVN